MKEIQSTKNTLIKQLKKLHKKKQRIEEQKYLLEGFHLIEEAFGADQTIEMLFVTQRGQKEWGTWITTHAIAEVYLVSDEVMASVSDLPTPQGILAVMQMNTAEQPIFTGHWLLLDNVQDPGNVGTMIRTADAAGFTGVVLGTGTADMYSTKVLRSMQGSNYHLPIIQQEIQDLLPRLKEQEYKIYGTELNEEALPLQEVHPTAKVALIMGNEGQGVTKELLEQTDNNIYIPIYGKAESLNVGVAAGILMYHFVLK
ncbi:MAG: TrmH family RNA methyltransferase [Enterococcus sp.]